MAQRDGDVATFAPTRRQIFVLQLIYAPLIVGLTAVLVIVMELTAKGLGELALSLAVILAASLLTLFAAPWWAERTTVTDGGIRLNDRPWVTGPANFARWESVTDITTVRGRGRTRVVLRLGSGESRTLPAPYDGRGNAHDPDFGAKLDVILQAWRAGHDPAR